MSNLYIKGLRAHLANSLELDPLRALSNWTCGSLCTSVLYFKVLIKYELERAPCIFMFCGHRELRRLAKWVPRCHCN